MEKYYRRYISILLASLIIFAVCIGGFFFFATKKIVDYNKKMLTQMVTEKSEEEMKLLVGDVIANIEERQDEIFLEVKHMADHLERYINTASALPQTMDELSKHINVIAYGEVLNVLIEETAGNATLLVDGQCTEVAFEDSSLYKKMKDSPIYKSVERDNFRYHIFAKQSDIDAIVKKLIHREIHNTMYGDEKYVWVNEIVNPEGGDNYAIRVIHPNLVDTEGSYLSTNDKDVMGNLPYLTELEGILLNGEITHKYYFKKLNTDEMAEKLSYAKLYEPYQWIVATGQPLEDMLKMTDEVAKKSLFVANGFAVICVLAEIVLITGILFLHRKYHKNINSYITRETELDHLTGAMSRKAGERELGKNFKRYRKKGSNCIVFMIDVDRFKSINDTYGHEVGDRVLRQVVSTVSANIRESDQLIRWGGDEFILICQSVDSYGREKVAEKILNCVRDIEIMVEGQMIPITVSIGCSNFKTEDKDILEIISRADVALYRSKEKGRNRWTNY